MSEPNIQSLLMILDWLIQEYEDGDGTIPDGLYNAAVIAVRNAK